MSLARPDQAGGKPVLLCRAYGTVCIRHASAGAWVVGLVLCIIAGTGGRSAEAQTVTATTGAVNGVVTDSTKAVVPGVTKLNGTMNLGWGFLVAPVVRHQSGTPFARTFVQTLNYGSATIKAEPIAANRTPDITLVDVRTEKTFRIDAVRVMGFFDVYNMFNTNAEQTLTTTSGGSWLRPTVITAPRVLRIGARLQW